MIALLVTRSGLFPSPWAAGGWRARDGHSHGDRRRLSGDGWWICALSILMIAATLMGATSMAQARANAVGGCGDHAMAMAQQIDATVGMHGHAHRSGDCDDKGHETSPSARCCAMMCSGLPADGPAGDFALAPTLVRPVPTVLRTLAGIFLPIDVPPPRC